MIILKKNKINFIRALKNINLVYILYKKICEPTVNIFVNSAITFFYIFDVLIFCLSNLKIFDNKIIYIFLHNSFGHQVIGYDWASRLYWPNKVSLIEIPQPGNNSYLSECYKNFNIFKYDGFLYKKKYINGKIVYRILRAVLGFICSISDKNTVIDLRSLYGTLSLVEDGVTTRAGDDSAEAIIEYYHTTGRDRLVRDEVGEPPRISNNRKEFVEKIICKTYPKFFDKPFICILLRSKEEQSIYWNSNARNAKSQKNYRKAVDYITGSGYYVVGAGETESNLFSDLAGFFDFKNLGIDQALLNLYLLSECAYFIGQNSGPVKYINSIGKPLLITDALPHWSGTVNKKDIILHKVFVDKDTNIELSLKDITGKHINLFYGVGTQEFFTRENNEKELLDAVVEFLNGVDDPLYQSKLSSYHESIPRDTLAYISKNRIPSFRL